MSPLQLKTRNLEGTGWIKFGDPLEPGEQGKISNFPLHGEKEIYSFYCKQDNSSSVIQRKEDITELKVDSDPFDMDIRTQDGFETQIRFIHKER